jgi:5-(carboxyamino)imidazole ribonucleotide mutase
MGSKSDFSIMRSAVDILRDFAIPHEARVVSAHRTPDLLYSYAEEAQARGLRLIIAGAGGAAHLPGMIAAKTIVPVLGVPIPATALQGMDALLSIVQMPKGVPVATFAIGAPGAANAALFAIATLATTDPDLADRLTAWRNSRRDEVLAQSLNETPEPGLTGTSMAEPATGSPKSSVPADTYLAEKTYLHLHASQVDPESTIDRLEESAL